MSQFDHLQKKLDDNEFHPDYNHIRGVVHDIQESYRNKGKGLVYPKDYKADDKALESKKEKKNLIKKLSAIGLSEVDLSKQIKDIEANIEDEPLFLGAEGISKNKYNLRVKEQLEKQLFKEDERRDRIN